MPDAMVTNRFSESVASLHEDLPVHSSSDVPVRLKEVTRSLNNLSWHTAGVECQAEASVHAVHEAPVPPDIHVLYQDWSKSHAKDKVSKKLWAELETTEYVDDPKSDAYFLLQKGKIFHQGEMFVYKVIFLKMLAAVHLCMPIRAYMRLDNLLANGSRYLMICITLYLYLTRLTHWFIFVLYVNRLRHVAAVHLIHWMVLPSLNMSSTVFLWILWNSQIVPPRMPLCTTMLCVLYAAKRLRCNHSVCEEGRHLLGCGPKGCGARICYLWVACCHLP